MEKTSAFLTVCMNPTLQKTLCFDHVIPGSVNRTAFHRLDASGKGINVTRVLSQLGKKAIHLTHLGGTLRPLFLGLCEKEKLNVHWVESGSAIRFCYTVISGKTTGSPAEALAKNPFYFRTLTELVEEGENVTEGTEGRLLAAYLEILDSVKTVIISGTKASGYSDALIPSMVRLAGKKRKRIILDIRGSDLKQSLLFRPNVIKPNLFEFADTFAAELEQCARDRGKAPLDYKSMGELSGNEPGVKENVCDLALKLAASYGIHIVLTRGTYPVWYTGGSNFFESPVKEIATINATGSGDAFTAGFAAALEEGLSLKDSVAQGIHCGALNAGLLKPGILCEV